MEHCLVSVRSVKTEDSCGGLLGGGLRDGLGSWRERVDETVRI